MYNIRQPIQKYTFYDSILRLLQHVEKLDFEDLDTLSFFQDARQFAPELLTYADLLQRLLQRVDAQDVPVEIFIDLLFSCNE